MSFVAVVLDHNLVRPLDYAVPTEFAGSVEVGTRVEVPFHKGTQKGTVVACKSHADVANVKMILRVLAPESVLSEPLLKLAEWMANYYAAPLQKVMRCFVPPSMRKEVSARKSVELEEEEFFPTQPKVLNAEQQICLDKIKASLDAAKFQTHLIQGVTGSGKTEIYLQAIGKALEQGKSAIMLVPEVALTSQMIERFRARFQEKIVLWHHRRSLGERTAAWESLRKGTAQIVIGARSAIFCPAQNVGLIIVDEEHDSSYKANDLPCYHGRDVAVMRGFFEKATVMLGSATPSLESRYNADTGKYLLSKLTARATSATLPKMTIVDMVRVMNTNGGFTHFSPELVSALKKRLEAGEQSLLLLNRRGYHRLQVCGSCRNVVKCQHCDLGLTYHKREEMLRCHLCGFQRQVPRNCPTCDASDTLKFQGFGTEHVERALHALLPEVRTLRMDRDTTTKKESHEALYKQFRAHKADVLIGTQMIAKGFHFPSVTLVGILSVDAPLSVPDFRSAEQVFQLITQVAGRAGRSELSGEVILQTFIPDHPVLKLASTQDYEAFYTAELAERKLFCYPPFCQLVKVSCSGRDATETEKRTKALREKFKAMVGERAEVLAVLPAGHAKVKDEFHFQFVIKTAKIGHITEALRTLSECKIDVNPISTFF